MDPVYYKNALTFWKSPELLGATMCTATETPPALCPDIVTSFGSPPNAAIFILIHSKANL